METLELLNTNGEKAGHMELIEGFFLAEPKSHLFHEVVRAKMADWRQGTADTKERCDVRGGGKKPFRQKGTGRARQGTSRSPVMVGGGTIFGPHPRSYHIKVNKKVRKLALQSAISVKKQENKFIAIDSLHLDEIKTKMVKAVFDRLSLKKALVVDENNERLMLSVRNLKSFQYSDVSRLSVYDILKFENLVISGTALKTLEKRFCEEMRG